MSSLPHGPTWQFEILYRYARDPIGCMTPLAKKYGDPFTLPGETPLVCTGDPAGLKAIYALHRPENRGSLERLRDELGALGADAEVEKVDKQPYLASRT